MIVFIVFILIIVIVLKINSSKIKGSIGEAKVNTRLNFIGKEYIVLKDILIKSSNGYTSQMIVSNLVRNFIPEKSHKSIMLR